MAWIVSKQASSIYLHHDQAVMRSVLNNVDSHGSNILTNLDFFKPWAVLITHMI
jgi:hypothetical protein